MEPSSTTYPATPSYQEEPQRGLLWRLLLGAVPVLLIAVAVYVVFNFPALWTRLTFLLSDPQTGSAATLPETVRTSGSSGESPDGGPAGVPCQGNIPYDGQGRPRAICDNYLYIPRIRVAAPIVRPDSTAEAVINDALLKGVIKYPGTAEPGEQGNVFLTGHSSYYWWVKTDYRNVFALVPQLRQNDEIVIYARGRKYSYRVHAIFEVDPTQTGVLKPTPVATVTLSTCVPVGTSARRKIVQARQVSPDPADARPTSGQAANPDRLPGVR
ncbi:MAG TPA: sortase [Patescibacteria group bacterium]|jgi:LPXTG-site transpeptidase (sortase) family protein